MNISKYSPILLLSCIFFVLLPGTSCKKFLAVDLPVSTITSESVFANEQTATAAVTGIYSQMMPTSLFYSSGGTSIYAGLLADELFVTNQNNANDIQFYENSLLVSNGILRTNFWNWIYKMNYQANICIEKLSTSQGLSPQIRDRLTGEAKFIRALNYFYLVNLFGDVPLVTGTNYKLNAVLQRSPVSAVYQQIISDLVDAKSLLPVSYPSGGKLRPNKWTATALLARVYLYQQDWAKAENEATEILNAGTYNLEPILNNVFLLTSKEAIWQLMPVEAGFNTTVARYLLPTAAATNKPAYAITPWLHAVFSIDDKRKQEWIRSKTVAGEFFNYVYKYKVRNLNLPVTEGYTVLRLAEVYLIRAEALAHQNKIIEAKTDLDMIRSRAGIPGTDADYKEALLDAIIEERQKELFAEWGHRWFDLKRTNRALPALSPNKNIQAFALLLPIPQTEILRNPALIQNPGY